MYTHLSLAERENLFAWKEQGVSLREIGRRLGRPDATIGRELKTNAVRTRGLEKTSVVYLPCKAQEKAERRARTQRSQASWKGPTVYSYVKEKLRLGWSPEAIAGRITIDHKDLSICHETIYQYIYAAAQKKKKLWEHLTVGRKKRRKKGGRQVHRESRIPEAISIDKRPQYIEKRKQAGHWESDCIIGKATDKTALSTTVERVSKVALLGKLTARTADAKTQALFARMAGLPKNLRRTLTVDNGAENTQHQVITQSLSLAVYYCHAYHAWEKGTNENTNGRVRRFIPKGVSIDTIDEQTIRAIEWRLNNTPRKCLNFKTPLEVFQQMLDNT